MMAAATSAAARVDTAVDMRRKLAADGKSHFHSPGSSAAAVVVAEEEEVVDEEVSGSK